MQNGIWWSRHDVSMIEVRSRRMQLTKAISQAWWMNTIQFTWSGPVACPNNIAKFEMNESERIELEMKPIFSALDHCAWPFPKYLFTMMWRCPTSGPSLNTKPSSDTVANGFSGLTASRDAMHCGRVSSGNVGSGGLSYNYEVSWGSPLAHRYSLSREWGCLQKCDQRQATFPPWLPSWGHWLSCSLQCWPERRGWHRRQVPNSWGWVVMAIQPA